jgi:putative transposase
VQGSLSICEMCEWLQVSRLSFYRYWQAKAPKEEETALRDRLQALFLEHPGCGSRRLSQWLRREGENVNRKRVHSG